MDISCNIDAEATMLELEKRLHELQTKKHEYFTLLKQILHEDEKRKQDEAEKRRAEEAQRIIIQREELRVKQEQIQQLLVTPQNTNFITQTPSFHNSDTNPSTSTSFYNQPRTLFNNQPTVTTSTVVISNPPQNTVKSNGILVPPQTTQQHIMTQIPQVVPQQILRSPPTHQPTIINYQPFAFTDHRASQTTVTPPTPPNLYSDHSRQLPLQPSVLPQVSGSQNSFFSSNQAGHYNNFINTGYNRHMQMIPNHMSVTPSIQHNQNNVTRQNLASFSKSNTRVYNQNTL